MTKSGACDGIGSIKRVLVVGSWAKEQITIENIKRNSELKVFAYMDTKNPGIAPLVDGFHKGSLSNVRCIVDYAMEKNIDLVIITTASPLSAGVADALEEAGIPAFGPKRSAARLESDKAFTRGLMKKYRIEAIPDFNVFDRMEEAVEFARLLDWNVAVKPVGLTEGLGVMVFGDQLKNGEEVVNYIEKLFIKRIGGDARAIIEEKVTGEEFTVQCFVNDDLLIPTPCVQDFKKLLPGERGPNTASMGSFSHTGYLLPFMTREDYQGALEIMRDTVVAFRKETGEVCRGFLYGQFMITGDGLRLIEYNFRPGDPEWMNIVILLNDNIVDIIKSLFNGYEKKLTFNNKATVCKYIVPKGYPERLNETLNVSMKAGEVEKAGVNIYYSCGLDAHGKLNVGSERGIAFIAKADSIFEANDSVEDAISQVKGEFFHRYDIGTKEMVETKVNHVKQLKMNKPVIRRAREEEFLDVYRFVSSCPPLEKYFMHVFKIILRYFGDTCFVAEYENEMVGWVMGFLSQRHKKTYFLWQIGVKGSMQGKGMGKLLLKEVERGIRRLGCKRIEVTIDPENRISQMLFESMGYRNVSQKEGQTVEVMENPAIKDYYSPGRHFMLYEKAL